MLRTALVLLLARLAVGQEVDPYTAGSAAPMAALGIRNHGPFLLGERHATADVMRELGNPALRWLETAHFRIGGDLAPRPLPEGKADRATLLADCQAMHRALPAFPDRPRQLDGWQQLLLHAHRLERTYHDLQRLAGVDDAWFVTHAARGTGGGPNLGCDEKFVVLLFQREGDLARYLRTWCQTTADRPWTWRYRATMNWGFATSTESCRGELAEPAVMAAHVVFFSSRNLIEAWLGAGKAPFWWQDGLAQWFAQRVTTGLLHNSAALDPDRSRLLETNWPRQVRARLTQKLQPTLTDMLCWRSDDERPLADHTALWSLIDWLVQADRAGVARLFQHAREHPIPDLHISRDQSLDWHRGLLRELGYDFGGAERAWHNHVLAKYPRR